MNSILKYTFKLQGYPVDEAEKELSAIKKLQGTSLELRNEKIRWDIFNYHLANNQVYKGHINGKKIKEWSDIPVLKKSDLQLPLNERLTIGYHKGGMHIHSTSGSNGNPFFFAKDKFCHAMSWAIINDRFGWHGIEVGKSLQARFYGIPLGRSKYYKEKLKDCLAARIRFPVFDLTDDKLDQFIKKFHKYPFDYINGYTNSLVFFARYILKKGIVLKDICPTLRLVITTSEVCDNIDRDIMRSGFGVEVINEYGASELDLIAVEDTEGDWLLNYESLFVEFIGANGDSVGPDEEGKVVITSLYNKAMPFIRYELGDTAVLSSRKKGNYSILDNVCGRTNDLIVLPSGKKSPGFTFYYISKSLLEKGGIIKEFIIRQTAIDFFIFEYVADRALTSKEEQEILNTMEKYLEPGLKASFERKAVIQRTKAGKLKHFFSELTV